MDSGDFYSFIFLIYDKLIYEIRIPVYQVSQLHTDCF